MDAVARRWKARSRRGEGPRRHLVLPLGKLAGPSAGQAGLRIGVAKCQSIIIGRNGVEIITGQSILAIDEGHIAAREETTDAIFGLDLQPLEARSIDVLEIGRSGWSRDIDDQVLHIVAEQGGLGPESISFAQQSVEGQGEACFDIVRFFRPQVRIVGPRCRSGEDFVDIGHAHRSRD